MDAVGSHQNIPLKGRPVGNCDGDTFFVLVKGDDLRTQAKSLLAQGIEEHPEQFGAVHVIVRRAEAQLGPLAERRPKKTLAGVPGAVVSCLGIDSDACESFAHTECRQDSGGVTAQLNASSNLPKGRRLLEQLCVNTAGSQRKRGRYPSNSPARDQD